MTNVSVFRALIATGLVSAAAACTVHKTEVPSLTGPSELALSLNVVAIPDSINQDGGSQSSIRVTVKGPDGKPISGLPIRMDMQVNGLPQDFGTLSARTIVTGTDGTGFVVYTAPPGAPGGVTGTCGSLPGTCVTIVATPMGSDFAAAIPRAVDIRLVPTGVILPPPDTPTAVFQFSPATVAPNQTVTFDATASCGGTVSASGACQSSNQIVSYSWTFGDGSTGSGRVVSHSYATVASFVVTLTVTNDRGVAASTTKNVPVSASPNPSAEFVFSPAAPRVGDSVFFNGDQSAAAVGRRIVRYDWDFGDGTTATGSSTSHQYAAANVYVVQLKVTDDLGQVGTKSTSVTILP